MDISRLTTAPLLEVAQHIERGDISPVELTEAMLTRISELDGKIKSYLLITEDLALRQARDAEVEIQVDITAGHCTGCRLHSKT